MKCRYAFPGCYNHECGAPATSVLISVMTESTRQALSGLGVMPPPDGLARAERCDTHRGVQEYGDGAIVRTESL